jgi:hypothetical protein
MQDVLDIFIGQPNTFISEGEAGLGEVKLISAA